MNIHLSKDLEQIVHNAVRAGLYAREDDVIRDALTRLEQTMPKPARTSGKKANRTKATLQKLKKPLTEAEFNQHLLSIGLITSLPDPALDIDDDDPDDQPVTMRAPHRTRFDRIGWRCSHARNWRRVADRSQADRIRAPIL